jgi:protein phosphatase
MDPALDLPAVEYAERSDPGRDPSKQVNEDACGRRETRLGHLCVVCDGMGGHAAGREAAELALATIFATFDQAPEGALAPAVLRAAIEEASRRVYAMPTTEVALGRPGSTVVAVLMHAHGTEVAHVGDSRVYLVHEGQIHRVTRDHSIVQELVDRGLLTPEQAARHPDANRITRALGMSPEVEADVRLQPVQHVTGDAFVLCSDGLSDLVDDAEILQAVEGVPAVQAVGKLVDLANARGGHDNVTVLVLRARSSATGAQSVVSPTVAQTNVTQAYGADVPATFPDGRFRDEAGRATEVPRPPAPLSPAGSPALAPTPPPIAPRKRTARMPPAVAIALVLAVLAVGLLAAVLAANVAERGGTHNTSSEATGEASAGAAAPLLPDAGRRPVAPTPLVPENLEVPSTGAGAGAVPPGGSIAPLEPALDPLPHGKRKR